MIWILKNLSQKIFKITILLPTKDLRKNRETIKNAFVIVTMRIDAIQKIQSYLKKDENISKKLFSSMIMFNISLHFGVS